MKTITKLAVLAAALTLSSTAAFADPHKIESRHHRHGRHYVHCDAGHHHAHERRRHHRRHAHHREGRVYEVRDHRRVYLPRTYVYVDLVL